MLGATSEAAAQSACDSDCPDYLEDERGCCPRPLPPPDAPGHLRIDTDPAGARVSIDGAPRGVTPLQVQSIPPGVYHVRIEAEGRPPWTHPVLVRPAEAVHLQVELCDAGRVDAGGVCCWPGQSLQAGRCTGQVQCPAPLVADPARTACVSPVCTEGRVHVEGGACCWRGQRWDADMHVCRGTPTRCPDDRFPLVEQCEVVPSLRDGDRDGVRDDVDRCPDQPEDRDGWQDADGCPDPDNDHDGIADGSDLCPNVAEDRDGIADTDGCPETDADGDGVADTRDRCPLVAEDRDGWQDADGCPDPDDDGDGIADAVDHCPRGAETANGYEDADGCPDATPPLFGLGRSTLGVAHDIRISFADGSPGVRLTSRLSWLGGVEVGVTTGLAEQPGEVVTVAGMRVRTGASSIASAGGGFVGIAPLRLGLWVSGRVGGDRLTLLEPVVQLAWPAPTVTLTPSVVLGNRITYDALYAEADYRLGAQGIGSGPEIAVGVQPNLQADGGRWSKGLDLGLAMMTYMGGMTRLGLDVLLGYDGVSAGLSLVTDLPEGTAAPFVELAPVLVGDGERESDGTWQWTVVYFEPFVRATWFGLGAAPSLTLGTRFRVVPAHPLQVWFELGYRTAVPAMADGLVIGVGMGL